VALFHIADCQSVPGVDWVKVNMRGLEHLEKLRYVERLGTGLDYHYVRLTPTGKTAVEEAIAAMRAVH
jgi:DNA-binding MarR family transcriptional regulator